MKIRSYCEKIGHRVSGKLTLIANTGCFRTYLDEEGTSYIIDTETGDIIIRQRRKPNDNK